MLLCFHWNVFKVCCYIFHWNVFDIYVQMLSDRTLVLFLETKWHDNLIICILKHSPLMYNKNVKKLLKYCVVNLLF